MQPAQEASVSDGTRSGREAERARIVHEMHDQVIQALIALNYQLSHIRARPEANLDEQLCDAQQHVRHLLHTVRNICADLRPAPLDLLGLMHAMREIVALLNQAAQPTTLRITGDTTQQIHPDITFCLLRVLQESLANTQKHARAQHVQIELHLGRATLTLCVSDDGVGFALPATLTRAAIGQSFGLASMRERLQLVNGELVIVSAPGAGTQVEARVPCGY